MIAFIFLLFGCDKSEEKKIQTYEDLNGKIIGVELKTTGEIYASEIKGATVQSYNRSRDAVLSLKKGKIDAVMVDKEVARVYLKEYENLKIIECDTQEEEYAIAIKKGNEELKNKIDTALDTIKENGILDEILNSWLYEGNKKSVYSSKDDSNKNGKLLVVTEANFPPYEFIEDDEIIGIDIDIMKAICDELDMELEVRNIAFEGILSSIDREYADVGIAGLSITEERLQQVDFSKPYQKTNQVIIVRE